MLEVNEHGCRFFKHDMGGAHSAAYMEMLVRYEYDVACYNTNPFAHCIAFMKQRGMNVELAYVETETGTLAADVKKVMLEDLDNFDPSEPQYERTLEILKLDEVDGWESAAMEYKEFVYDDYKLADHWNISTFFFKDPQEVFEKFDQKNRDFLVNKVRADKSKCLFLQQLKTAAGEPDPAEITVKQALEPVVAKEFEAEYRMVFPRTERKLNFTDKANLQTTVGQAYQTLFGNALVSSRRVSEAGKQVMIYELDDQKRCCRRIATFLTCGSPSSLNLKIPSCLNLKIPSCHNL